MDKDKNFGAELESGDSDSAGGGDNSAPRARNRTVMLTPEITGQVRARLAQDAGPGGGSRSGSSEGSGPIPDLSGGQSGAFYTPASRGRPLNHEAQSPTPVETPRPTRSAPPPVAAPQAEAKEGLVWSKKTPVVGFLISFDANPLGDFYELRGGRLIITSESAGQGNYLLIKDESVSPMHAILRVSQTGEVQVLDQLSEFGTRIRKFGATEDQELSGDKGTVEHGDTVSFGKRRYHVCMISFANPT